MGKRISIEENMVARSLSKLQTPSSMIKEQVDPSKFQKNPQEIQTQQTIKSQPEKKSLGTLQTPSTYQGEPDPTTDEGMFEYLVRNTTANASRMAEQIGGRYGNIEKFAKDVLTSVPQTGGLIGWAPFQLMGQEPWETFLKGTLGHQQTFPISTKIKQISLKATWH